MNVLAVVGNVTTSLIELAIVFAILTSAHDSGQGLLGAGLVLLYLRVVHGFAALGLAGVVAFQLRARQFSELAALLNHPEQPTHEEALAGIAEERNKQQRKFWIETSFRCVGMLAALWAVLVAL
jgi:hypothetical protein